MKFDPQKHHRRSIRLQGYDYSSAGAYFVTIVAWQREMLFGDIVNGEMILNRNRYIVRDAWFDLPNHYRHVELGAFVIMPNHVHGVIVLIDDGRGGSPTTGKTISPDDLIVDADPMPINQTRPYAKNQTAPRIARNRSCVQIVFIETDQPSAPHERNSCLAAQLLRTHHLQ